MTQQTYADWPAITRTDNLRIYNLERPIVDERSLRGLSSMFGLEPAARHGRLAMDADTISYAVGMHVVTVYRASGALRYQNVARWQVDDGSNVQLPEETAVGIARRYIEARNIVPLDEIRLAYVSRLRVGVANRQGDAHEERVIDLGVIFQRIVDGMPVDGPGGKVVVYLDAAGEVTGLDRTWRTISGVRQPVEALRPPDDVLTRARRFWNTSTRMDVRQVRFGYFEQGFRTRQTTLQPAYVVMVTLRSAGDEELRRRSVYVQAAATNSVGVLQPPPSRPVAQTARPAGPEAPQAY